MLVHQNENLEVREGAVSDRSAVRPRLQQAIKHVNLKCDICVVQRLKDLTGTLASRIATG